LTVDIKIIHKRKYIRGDKYFSKHKYTIINKLSNLVSFRVCFIEDCLAILGLVYRLWKKLF